jgi:hypothetical protein
MLPEEAQRPDHETGTDPGVAVLGRFGTGDAKIIIDSDMDISPACAFACPAPVTGEVLAGLPEPVQDLDIHWDQFAGVYADNSLLCLHQKSNGR